MIDQKAQSILNRILAETSGDEPVVIDKCDLIAAVGSNPALTEGALNDLIEVLSVAELVKVKYSDKTSFCLSVLPKGRVAVSAKDEQFKDIGKIDVDINYKKVGVIAFFGSLVGAAFGGGLVAVLVWVVETFLI